MTLRIIVDDLSGAPTLRLIAAHLADGATADLFHGTGRARPDRPHAGGILRVDAHGLCQPPLDANGENAALHLDPRGFDPHEMRAATVAGGKDQQKRGENDHQARHGTICAEIG